jgi:hypothetical protein
MSFLWGTSAAGQAAPPAVFHSLDEQVQEEVKYVGFFMQGLKNALEEVDEAKHLSEGDQWHIYVVPTLRTSDEIHAVGCDVVLTSKDPYFTTSSFSKSSYASDANHLRPLQILNKCTIVPAAGFYGGKTLTLNVSFCDGVNLSFDFAGFMRSSLRPLLAAHPYIVSPRSTEPVVFTN